MSNKKEGELLKAYLVHKGVTNNEFAEAIGRKLRTVFQYYHTQRFNDATLKRICEYLDIPFNRKVFVKHLKEAVEGPRVTGEVLPVLWEEIMPEEYHSFKIRGNAMLPTLHDGDIVFGEKVPLDELTGLSYAYLGSIHVIVLRSGESLLKRISHIVDDQVLLKTDMPGVPSISYPVDQVRAIYRVFRFSSQTMINFALQIMHSSKLIE